MKRILVTGGAGFEGKRCAETLFFDHHRLHGVRIKVTLDEGLDHIIQYFREYLKR